MQRISGNNVYGSLPITRPTANTPGFFGPGVPAAGQGSTQVTYEWANSVQEEMAHAIEATGMALDVKNNKQLTAAIVLLASGGRSQREWTLTTPVINGGTLNFPPEVAYTVGAGALLLSWDGLCLSAKNYTEIGAVGERSTAVILLFDAPAGSEFVATLTAAGGGTVAVSIPPDVRERLDAAISRADAAAQAAEDAAARTGDIFFAVQK